MDFSVWHCVRLAARGQVLLTNMLVNAKNVDPHIIYVITDGTFQVDCNGW